MKAFIRVRFHWIGIFSNELKISSWAFGILFLFSLQGYRSLSFSSPSQKICLSSLVSCIWVLVPNSHLTAIIWIHSLLQKRRMIKRFQPFHLNFKQRKQIKWSSEAEEEEEFVMKGTIMPITHFSTKGLQEACPSKDPDVCSLFGIAMPDPSLNYCSKMATPLPEVSCGHWNSSEIALHTLNALHLEVGLRKCTGNKSSDPMNFHQLHNIQWD